MENHSILFNFVFREGASAQFQLYYFVIGTMPSLRILLSFNATSRLTFNVSGLGLCRSAWPVPAMMFKEVISKPFSNG